MTFQLSALRVLGKSAINRRKLCGWEQSGYTFQQHFYPTSGLRSPSSSRSSSSKRSSSSQSSSLSASPLSSSSVSPSSNPTPPLQLPSISRGHPLFSKRSQLSLSGFDIYKLLAAGSAVRKPGPLNDPWRSREEWRYTGPFTLRNRFKGALPGFKTALLAFAAYLTWEAVFP